MTDLLQATSSALYAALNVPSVTALAPVFASVPENQQPPFIEIGAIDAEEIGGKHSSLEQHSAEIQFQYRGRSKKPLFAMMHAARVAIETARLTAVGAVIEDARWLASATDREEDGVTHHGIHRFELTAQADD
jgi:hypothetical protein